MTVLAALMRAAGTWTGRSRLLDPHHQLDEECDSELTITPMLLGRFIRVDYTWSQGGKPQEGAFLIGAREHDALITGNWADSWHMSERVMDCTGSAAADGSVSLVGSYAAPAGPDWRWRTVIAPAPVEVRLVMYNVDPRGHEELAVDARYTRAAAGPPPRR